MVVVEVEVENLEVRKYHWKKKEAVAVGVVAVVELNHEKDVLSS